MSFLSALLERSPVQQAGRPSKRFSLIIRFLQEAAIVVPMESIVFAIADCSTLPTAYKCAQAVLSVAHTSSLPVSKLMMNGCNEGYRRLCNEGGHRLRFWSTSMMSDEEEYHYYPKELYYPSQRVYYTTVRHPSFYHPITHVKSSPQRQDSGEPRKHGKRRRSKQHPPQIQKIKGTTDLQDHHVPLASISLKVNPVHRKPLLYENHPDLIAPYFEQLTRQVTLTAKSLIPRGSLNLISGRNIGEAYPISKALSRSTDVGAFTPLPEILRKAREDLASLSGYNDAKLGSIATGNCEMLKTVNNIVKNHLNPCVTMLGGFMEQQIRVPLVNNPLDTAKALQTTDSSGAVGVWALFALDEKDIASILSSKRNQTLVIQITKFIEGILSSNTAEKKVGEQITSYNAKLQVLLQGMNKTVTCSREYISYSLERELVGICKERKITTTTNVGDILCHWDTQFKATALALVPKPYRPLLARWLIWALYIHQLREGLAKYTTVGVIGLVNSGKSTLVNKVFGIQVSNNLSVQNKVFCFML